MKTLLVLRHAKSSWDHPVSDHDRPLKKRGRRAAQRIGEELRELDLLPDVIISSTAKRARKTAHIIQEASGCDAEIIKTDDLYFEDVGTQIGVVTSGNDIYKRIMIVGHNPSFEEIVHELSGEDIVMATATLAVIDFDVESWSAISQGRLRLVLRPRELE
ncbi:MAG: histidine phosphatase family protein [Planctomycetota bacterium]|jgi:phosphohistidine phosphatase|nr:histidine phosphatase family protein [Planctomycetota bacterium]